MRRHFAALMAVAACTAIIQPAWSAPPENRGKPDHAGQGNGKNKGRDDDAGINVTLTTAGISISTARGYAVQAGATGYGSLPPGIRKNLARGKPLPPASPRRWCRSMLARLPVHAGYEWRVAGNDLILIAIASGVVADVLAGVFD
ncbi:anti-virulence regulator CigR family protein [Achromobacter insuavis]